MTRASTVLQLEKWREKLRDKLEGLARGKSGVAVVKAMHEAVQRANNIGLDDFYDTISEAKSTSGAWYAFDIMWLTALALELERGSKSHRKRKRKGRR